MYPNSGNTYESQIHTLGEGLLLRGKREVLVNLMKRRNRMKHATAVLVAVLLILFITPRGNNPENTIRCYADIYIS